jgi:uncharacterized phiE125 gp8 family phage protein
MPITRLSPVTPPSVFIVTLEEAKAHLQVNFADDDTLIADLIKAVQSGMEHELQRALTPQTFDLFYDSFPIVCGYESKPGIKLPLRPVLSVDSVNYVDPDSETETVLATSEYAVDTTEGDFGWIEPGESGWPSTLSTLNAVRVRFTAGWPLVDSPEVYGGPPSLKLAALLLLRDYYDQRGSFVTGTIVAGIPDAVRRLMQPFQEYWV